MKLFFALALALFLTIAAVGAEQRLLLDGRWHFTIDPTRLEQSTATWDTLPVPGNWDTVNAYSQHIGQGWYRREFTVPSGWEGQRIRIHFGAVYETAEVWLNGHSLGRHEGGYTPFEFDVTDQVKRDGPNTLTVCADNTFRRGAWWAWGGISRSVTLVANNNIRLVWQHIRAQPNLTTGTAAVTIEYLISNDGAAATEVEIAAAAQFEGVFAGRVSTRALVPARGTTRATASLVLPAEHVHLWHFDQPHLYHLTSTLRVSGAVQHELRHRFGVRQVEVKPDGLYLNGERVRLMGFNRVHDHRAYGNTEPDHLVKLDVDRMKRYSGNFMRIMHAPASPNLLDYLDERGVMVFTEIPVWGEGDPNVIPHNPRTQQWLREMIDRDYNHPSIIGWSVGNEMLNHYDYVKSMIDFTRRELDPYRLITYISYSGNRATYTPANDPISVSDLVMHNTYGPDPGRLIEALAEKWPNRPVFLAEFGGRQIGETLDSRIPGLDERWDTLAHRPHLIGAALWTFNDYRSNYRGSAPGELRSWGIVDLWRREKAAARDIARLHSPVRTLQIRGGQAWIHPRSADEFPSYTLRGYQLLWEWRTPDDVTQGGGIAALPEIAPDAAPFSVPLPGRPVSGTANTGNLVVTLLTPLGYVAHETATSSIPEPAALPIVTSSSAPTVNHVHPLDGGFMIGYSTHPDDTAFTVEYDLEKGKYGRRLTIAQKGALAIHGLENGRTYHGRLRREVAGHGASAWSADFTVTPDGGLPPASPTVLGVVRGPGRIAVRFAPVAKATGYRLRWGSTPKETRLVNTSDATIVVLTNLDLTKSHRFSVTALGEFGESARSNELVSTP